MREFITHFREEKLTVIGQYDPNNNLHLKVSRCSHNDQFCKKIGRENARKKMPQLVLHFDRRFIKKSPQQFFMYAADLCEAVFGEDSPPSFIVKSE